MGPLRIVLATLSLMYSGADSRAANIRWSAGNGTFHTPANWTGGFIPGVLDVAQFGRSVQFLPQTYTVSFNNNATNQALEIEDDQVTFDLNNRVYTVTADSGVLVGANTGNFAGRLTITNGTLANSTKIDVGAAANRVGFLTVGLSGLISGAANLNVGNLATGTLTVQAGGDISLTGATNVGVDTGITGTANIVGNGTIGSATLLTGGLNVGNAGNGAVNVQLGGLLQNSGAATIGVGAGVVNVMHSGSEWVSQGQLDVGGAGNGEVNITQGGRLTSTNASIGGANAAGSGEVNVDGAFSNWDNSGFITIGSLQVGAVGPGMLNISNQGVVETAFDGLIRGNGSVNVSGAGSKWSTGILEVANNNDIAGLNITGGGAVFSNTTEVSGSVAVDGTGSLWENRQFFASVGSSLTITNGGTVRTGGGGSVGGTATVSGANSLWDLQPSLPPNGFGVVPLSVFGNGDLTISNGGRVKSFEGIISGVQGADAHVTVGGGSVWEYSGKMEFLEFDADFIVGDTGNGTLEITGGGRVISTANSGQVINEIGSQAGSVGVVRVTGPGSLWDSSFWDTGVAFHYSITTVGHIGNGTLEITGGGAVTSDFGSIGATTFASGTVIVDGSGSQWLNAIELTVGREGMGTLQITNGATVAAESVASIGRDVGGRGTVTVSSAIPGADSSWQIGDRLAVGVFINDSTNTIVNGGEGTLRIQPGGKVTVAEETWVSGGDLLSLEGGTLGTTGIYFVGSGNVNNNFQWTSGTLHVGVFDGDLVNGAGVLAPGDSIGTTTIEGAYNQLSAAKLQMDVGGTVNRDVVEVHGNAFLGGALEITLTNGFVPDSFATIPIFVAADLFGSFDNVTGGQRLTTSDGLGSFVVNYGAGSVFDPDQVVLSDFLGSNGVPGDYNNDGIVNLADYTVWRNHLGAPAGTLLNDTVGGIIGTAQYNAWRANFGATMPAAALAGSPVPEPTTIAMLALAVCTAVTIRPRRIC